MVVPNAAGPTLAAESRASNVITQVATIMKPANNECGERIKKLCYFLLSFSLDYLRHPLQTVQ